MIPLAKQRNHAVNRIVPQNKKTSLKGRFSNASNCTDAALVEVTGLIAAVNHDFTSLYMLHYLKNLFSLNYNDFCPLICRGDVD